jgi:hypothetical protein
MVRYLDNPQSALRRGAGDHNQPGLDALAEHYRHAGLYYATPEMAALAVHAGGDLTEARWATADRPSACGLMAFADGVGRIDAEIRVPVDAVTWGPYQGGVEVWMHVSRRVFVEEHRRRRPDSPYRLVVEEMPPVVPLISVTCDITGDPEPFTPVGDGTETVLRALAASWLLMEQPTLVDRTIDRDKGPARRAAARAGLPDPEISVVDLRRQYASQDRDPDDGDEGGRRYRHRWVVSGHWRQQPHGPGREQRRKQWIPAHVKGPDGAPVLARERVNVWRR